MAKRALFQFHLSTAVVLMFAAGGIMWSNTRVTLIELGVGDDDCYRGVYGWPLNAAETYTTTPWDRPETVIKFDIEWLPSGIAMNALTALGMLAALAIGCEWQIRRRKAKQQKSER